jgi:hypothetical protein
VPTAATIEHLQARTKGGSHWSPNLALACPYCNQRKSNRELPDFLASGDWKLARPDLPEHTRDMLRDYFGWSQGRGMVSSGTTNSRLELRGGQVYVLVRPHSQAPWKRIQLGPETDPRVTAAAWEFLARHFTPPKPKPKRPPRAVFRARELALRRATVRPV